MHLLLDLLPGLQHRRLGLLREQRGGLIELLQVVVALQQLILLRVLLRHVEHVAHADRAVHGGGAQVHVTVRLMVVQVLALTHDVPSAAAPPPQPRRVLPPLHGDLHLTAEGAQGRVDVQVLEGATVPAEDVVEHGRQVKVPPQDVCFVGLRRQKRRLSRPHGLNVVLGGQVLPFAAHLLVGEAILGAVITLKQLALSVSTTAAAAATAAVIVVSRHPPAFEDAVDEHVSILRIDLPEAPLPRLVFLSGDLLETLVERQVVANRVL